MGNKEESLNKLFRAFPENSLKDRVRSVYYNIIQNSVKVHYRNGFVADVGEFSIRFPNMRIVLPDLETCVKGYLARYEMRKGDVVVDGGAYTGTFTMIAANMVGDEGKVIAFEPDTENHKRLLANIKLNDLKNVIVIPKGLWSSDTKLPFRDAHNIGSSFIFDEPCGDSIIDLPVVSLDREFERLGIEKVDFIKMDVEGAEIEAIKGAKNILAKSDAKLAIASYHVISGRETSFELEKLLGDMGYRAETSYPEHRTTYAVKY
jgi:FkbM family methyltransferase